MVNDETDFETWFSVLQINVLDNTGVDFQDESAVRGDFEATSKPARASMT